MKTPRKKVDLAAVPSPIAPAQLRGQTRFSIVVVRAGRLLIGALLLVAGWVKLLAIIRSLALWITVAACVAPASAQTPVPPTMEEIVAGWRELDRQWRDVGGTWTTRSEVSGPDVKPRSREYTYEYVRSGDQHRAIWNASGSGATHEAVYLCNSRYAGSLEKDPARHLWYVSTLFIAHSDTEGYARFRDQSILVGWYHPLISVDNYSLLKLWDAGRLVVDRIAPAASPNRWKLSFQFGGMRGDANPIRQQKGFLVLNAENFFCIEEQEIATFVNGRLVGNATWTITSARQGDRVLPTRIVTTRTNPSADGSGGIGAQEVRHMELTVAPLSPRPAAREFTFSAFGVPEPAQLGQGRSRLWVAVVLLALAAVALVIWFLRRR